MRCLAVLPLAFALVGCDAPPREKPSASRPAATTGPIVRGGAWVLPGEDEPRAEECLSQNPWARPFDLAVTQYAHDFLEGRPPPPGPVLSKQHLEGVFPPVWRVGDTWRIVVLARQDHTWTSPYRKHGYRFEVLREPDGPDGEYLLDVQPFLLDEDIRRLRAQGADIEKWRERLRGPAAATFWVRDFSFIALCAAVRGCQYNRNYQELDTESGYASGPHPYENAEARAATWHAEPIVAFPFRPPDLTNPTVYAVERRVFFGWEYAKIGWQMIHPTDDGLVFILASAWPLPGSCGDWQGGGSQVVWKRGDPWWSQVTLLDDALGIPVPGEERVDGHVLRGRLLRPGDPDWPQGDPPPPPRSRGNSG